MGGNVFKDFDKSPLTRSIKLEDIPDTVAYLEKVTGLDFTLDKDDTGVPIKWLGSTGRKSESGDLDLSVDERQIDKDTLIHALISSGFTRQEIRKTGDNVHLMTPIKGDKSKGFVQTDFMFTSDPEWQHFSIKSGLEGSEYRGEHRHILLASIARARGFKYSPKNGLVDEETNEVITKDPNTIAKKLLGQMATVKDLANVESIINVVEKLDNYNDLVAQARETLGKQGITLPEAFTFESSKTGTTQWFRKMMNRIK